MIKRPVLFLTILIIIGLIIIVIYKVQSDPFKNDSVIEGRGNMHEHDSDSISELYKENCVTCHGKVGQGQSGFPSLQKIELAMDEIKKLISTGQGNMPAFPHIKEPQLSQLAKMVKQFSDLLK